MPNVIPVIATWAANATITVTGSFAAGIKVGGFIGYYGSQIALVAASYTYSSIQAKKQAKAAKSALNEGRTFMFKQATALRQLIYGQIRTSGPLVFIDETGTNNEYQHLIVALAAHQCEEVTTVYFNDEALTLDGSGNVTSPAKYVGFARVETQLGTAAQTAYATLVSESPRWTTNHRLRGICNVYVRLKWSAEVFPTGRPNISALVKGKLVYDPRTTTTAFSANWALCLGDYLMDEEFGLGVALANINDIAWQAAANVADENVTLADATTEKRYTVSGQIASDTGRGDAIEQIVASAAGFIGFIGGEWIIHAGAYRTPTITFDENDIRGPISVQTKVSRSEIFNGGKGVFVSPVNDWQPADYPPITNATYTAEDGGVRIWRDFEWPFITSNATAQRVTKIELEEARQQIIVNLPLKLTGMQVQAGDNVMLTIARLGWSAKVFKVDSMKLVLVRQGEGIALGYDAVLRETASGVYDWNNGEETTIDLAPNTNLPDPSVVAAPTALTLTSDSTTTSLQSDGSVIPRIQVEWTAPADEFATSGGLIRVQYKLTASADWLHWATLGGDQVEIFITAIVVGNSYDVRIRAENRVGGVSSWVSATTTAAGDTTAPAAPTGLVASSGAGFISLDWNDNTELDLGEYGVYRHTSNVFASATKIAEVLASRFVDAGVTAGTTYYYWITAIDRSENESTESASANAAATAPISTAAPSTPSAPTFNTSGVYQAGDGTIFAFITINTPALPSGAVANDILYRVNGSSSWILADQQYAAGTARIDDLTPGITYNFGIRAISNGGAPSAVSATLSQAAPNKTAGPNAPTSFTATPGTSSSYRGAQLTFQGTLLYCSMLEWVNPTDSDFVYCELAFTTTDSDAAADALGSWRVIYDEEYNFGKLLLTSEYVRVRSVDATGNKSSWVSLGVNLNSASAVGIVSGNLTLQDKDDVSTSGISTGQSGTPTKILTRHSAYFTFSLTGGAPTEEFDYSISGIGFTTSPDGGSLQINDTNLIGGYNKGSGSSTSTNARLFVATIDGTNITAATYGMNIILEEN
jgi:hypothetical protein